MGKLYIKLFYLVFFCLFWQGGDSMIIKRVLNNNTILAEDDSMLEKMLLGKGIGFGKKKGDEVDKSKIEKVFVLDSKQMVDDFVQLVRDIPINHIELSRRIIEEAENDLECKFSNSIYIGLTDHINYALCRYHEKEMLTNALLWEIKKFYPKEFKAAKRSIELINYYEKVELTEDEVGFIAMHFVNGQQSGDAIHATSVVTKIMQGILNIVKFHYNIELDEESINYSRFITHIRFFLQRINNQFRNNENDDFVFIQVKGKYPEAFECVEKIGVYLQTKLNISLSNEEMLYFMLHIKRLTERERNEVK